MVLEDEGMIVEPPDSVELLNGLSSHGLELWPEEARVWISLAYIQALPTLPIMMIRKPPPLRPHSTQKATGERRKTKCTQKRQTASSPRTDHFPNQHPRHLTWPKVLWKSSSRTPPLFFRVPNPPLWDRYPLFSSEAPSSHSRPSRVAPLPLPKLGSIIHDSGGRW